MTERDAIAVSHNALLKAVNGFLDVVTDETILDSKQAGEVYAALAAAKEIERKAEIRRTNDAPISNNQRIIPESTFVKIKVALGGFAYCVQGNGQLTLDKEQAAHLADMLAVWAHDAKGLPNDQ